MFIVTCPAVFSCRFTQQMVCHSWWRFEGTSLRYGRHPGAAGGAWLDVGRVPALCSVGIAHPGEVDDGGQPGVVPGTLPPTGIGAWHSEQVCAVGGGGEPGGGVALQHDAGGLKRHFQLAWRRAVPVQQRLHVLRWQEAASVPPNGPQRRSENKFCRIRRPVGEHVCKPFPKP